MRLPLYVVTHYFVVLVIHLGYSPSVKLFDTLPNHGNYIAQYFELIKGKVFETVFLYSEIFHSKYIRLALKDLNKNWYFIGTAGGYN